MYIGPEQLHPSHHPPMTIPTTKQTRTLTSGASPKDSYLKWGSVKLSLLRGRGEAARTVRATAAAVGPGAFRRSSR